MGKSRYSRPIVPWNRPEFVGEPNDPIDRLIVKAQAAFDKVSYFPDETPENWMNFISLRNLLPDLIRELKHFNAKKKAEHAKANNNPDVR